MTTTTTTVRLVEADPTALVIDPNVRLSPTLDKDFLASIRDNGVLQPVTAVERDGVLHVRYGQRRTLAAVQVERPTIPVFVVPDADDATVIVEQLAENDHRAAITEADRGHAVEALTGLGLTAAAIAKRTKMTRTTVDAALTVRASQAASHAVETLELTLEQGAILAEFESDAETLAALTEAAEEGRFDHAAQRAINARDAYAAAQAESNRLAEAGYVIREEAPAWDEKVERLDSLRAKDAEPGVRPDPAAYLATGDLTVAVRPLWDGSISVTYYIANARRHGLIDRYGSTTGSGTGNGPMTEEQKAERRELIANNKAWKAAEQVRRRWLTTFAARKTSPKDGPVWLATALAGRAYSLDRAANGQHALARELLGLPAPSGYGDTTLTDTIAKASTARAAHIALVIALASVEDGTGTHTWRNQGDQTYFAALARWGYTLSDVEALVLPAPTE